MDTGLATIIASIIGTAGLVCAAVLQRPPLPKTAADPQPRPSQPRKEVAARAVLRWGWTPAWAYAVWLGFNLDAEVDAATKHFVELESNMATAAQVSAATAQHALAILPLVSEQLVLTVVVGVWGWVLYKRSFAAD